MRLDRPWEMSQVLPLLAVALDNAFSELRAVGYISGPVQQKWTSARGNYLECTFRNIQANRDLQIDFDAGSIIFLSATFWGEGEYLFLSSYLKHIGVNEEATFLGEIHPDLDLEPQLSVTLSKIEELLMKHAYSIVVGETWLSLPFDWGDYK